MRQSNSTQVVLQDIINRMSELNDFIPMEMGFNSELEELFFGLRVLMSTAGSETFILTEYLARVAFRCLQLSNNPNLLNETDTQISEKKKLRHLLMRAHALLRTPDMPIAHEVYYHKSYDNQLFYVDAKSQETKNFLAAIEPNSEMSLNEKVVHLLIYSLKKYGFPNTWIMALQNQICAWNKPDIGIIFALRDFPQSIDLDRHETLQLLALACMACCDSVNNNSDLQSFRYPRNSRDLLSAIVTKRSEDVIASKLRKWFSNNDRTAFEKAMFGTLFKDYPLDTAVEKVADLKMISGLTKELDTIRKNLETSTKPFCKKVAETLKRFLKAKDQWGALKYLCTLNRQHAAEIINEDNLAVIIGDLRTYYKKIQKVNEELYLLPDILDEDFSINPIIFLGNFNNFQETAKRLATALGNLRNLPLSLIQKKENSVHHFIAFQQGKSPESFFLNLQFNEIDQNFLLLVDLHFLNKDQVSNLLKAIITAPSLLKSQSMQQVQPEIEKLLNIRMAIRGLEGLEKQRKTLNTETVRQIDLLTSLLEQEKISLENIQAQPRPNDFNNSCIQILCNKALEELGSILELHLLIDLSRLQTPLEEKPLEVSPSPETKPQPSLASTSVALAPPPSLTTPPREAKILSFFTGRADSSSEKEGDQQENAPSSNL